MSAQTETETDRLDRIEAKLDALAAEVVSFKESVAGFMAGPGKTLLKMFGGR